MLRRLLGDYGMILALLALCVLFSILTLKEQMPEGPVAAKELAERVASRQDKADVILAVGAVNTDSAALARRVAQQLEEAGFANARVVVGEPRDLRLALDEMKCKEEKLAAVVTSGDVVKWRGD